MINKSDLIEIRKKLSKILFKFSETVSKEGFIIIYDGELVEGLEVFTYDENGAKIALANGSYTIIYEDNSESVIEVVDGKIATITKTETAETTEDTLPDEMNSNLELESKIKMLEDKLLEMSEIILKMNEAVLAFGNQTEDIDRKIIEIKDNNVSRVSPAKYFQK